MFGEEPLLEALPAPLRSLLPWFPASLVASFEFCGTCIEDEEREKRVKVVERFSSYVLLAFDFSDPAAFLLIVGDQSSVLL